MLLWTHGIASDEVAVIQFAVIGLSVVRCAVRCAISHEPGLHAARLCTTVALYFRTSRRG